MKKFWLIFVLCMPLISLAAGLPISAEGKQEADFYLEFLKASFQAKDNAKMLCDSYEKLLPKNPTNKYLRRQMFLCALESSNLEKAKEYADYIEQEDNDADDLAVYALYLWRKGDMGPAQDYYEQALQKNPDDTRVLNQYLLLLSTIDVDRAAQKLKERQEEYPEHAAGLEVDIGNLYRVRKDFNTALYHYNQASKINPAFIPAYVARAEVYASTRQYFLMMHELETLEKMGYESANIFTSMGAFYILVKDEPKAKIYFKKAKELEKGNVGAGEFLAKDAEKNKNFAQAAQYLRETNDFSTSADKWLQVSFYEQRSGDNQAALRTLQEAYEKFDKSVEIGYFYALLLHDEEQYSRAEKILKQVLTTNPQYENARMAYAYTLESLKKYKKMEEQVKLVLAQNPKNAGAYNLLGFSLAERNKRLDEAQEYVTKALALAPQDLSFQDSLGWVYYRQGKYEPALNIFTQMPEKFIKENPEVSYHLGSVYAAMGDAAKAAIYLQQAGDYPGAAKLLKKIRKDNSK